MHSLYRLQNPDADLTGWLELASAPCTPDCMRLDIDAAKAESVRLFHEENSEKIEWMRENTLTATIEHHVVFLDFPGEYAEDIKLMLKQHADMQKKIMKRIEGAKIMPYALVSWVRFSDPVEEMAFKLRWSEAGGSA